MTPDELERFERFRRFEEWERTQQRAAPAAAPAERTVLELWDEYIASLPKLKHGRRSVGAIRMSFRPHLVRPFRHRGQELVLGELRPSACSLAVLTSWQAALGTYEKQRGNMEAGKGMAPGSIDQVRMSVQAMFSHYVKLQELASNPMAPVERVADWKRRRQGYATWDQTVKLAAAMPPIGGYMLRHEFRTMLRKNDIRLLQKTQIFWEARKLSITVKGGKQVLVACPQDVMDDYKLLVVLAPGDYVYPNPKDPHGGPVGEKTFWRWLRRASKDTGITHLAKGERTTHHHFRHGGAVDKADKMPITLLQHQLAHSDVATTAIYIGMRGALDTMLHEKMDEAPGPRPAQPPKP